MPKLQCLCGTLIDYGSIPNSVEWKLVSDADFDRLSDQPAKLYGTMTVMFRCPVCSRLWIFWDGFDKRPELYERVERW